MTFVCGHPLPASTLIPLHHAEQVGNLQPPQLLREQAIYFCFSRCLQMHIPNRYSQSIWASLFKSFAASYGLVGRETVFHYSQQNLFRLNGYAMRVSNVSNFICQRNIIRQLQT